MGESLAETRTIVAHNERAVMAAEQGLEIAQDNTIYAQRAYVSITRGTVSGNCFDLMIENSGNTPSSDTQMRCAVELRPGAPELPVSSEQPHEYTYIGLIAPHGLFSTQQRTAAEITPAQYRQIAAEEIALWCYGEIMYVDTFGRRRHTRFCFHQETGSSALQPWVEGNEAD